MNDLRLIVGLVRVDRQQVEISREDLLRGFSIIFQDLLENILHSLIALPNVLRHIQRHRDLLIARQILSHVRQGQKSRVFQQKARKHQRRNAGELACARFPLTGTPVGIILRVPCFVSIFHHTVLRVKIAGTAILLSILEHKPRDDAVEQVKNTGGIAIDKGRRHTDKELGGAVQLRHCVTLAAGIVVFVQLIAEEGADPAVQLFLDVGAQRITPLCAANRIVAVRVLRDLCELVANVRVFRTLEMSFSAIAVYPSVFADLDPFHPSVRIDRRP